MTRQNDSSFNAFALGRDEQARAEVREVLRLHPKFSLDSFAKTLTFNDQSFVNRRLELMRKAGLK